MLRASTNTLVRASTWRNPVVYSSLKCYSTPTPDPETEKPSLSQRLGGSGRGKIVDVADPFASFLNNAKKNNTRGNNRNGNFTPRNRKQLSENKGQFEDAAADSEVKPRRNRQPRNNDKKETENLAGNNNNNRNQRNDKNNNNTRGNKRLNARRSQPQEVRTRRAITFIDKEIDWASFDTTAATPLNEIEAVEQADDSNELVLKDIQGDYDRYLGVGADINWNDVVKGDTVSTLVGSNPSLDLQQKIAFLNAVSKATTTIAARK